MITFHLIVELALRVVLLSIYIWTDLQTPFIRVIQPEEWWLYKNPYSESSHVTVSTTNLFWIVIFIPSVIFVLFGLCTKQYKDTATAMLGLTMSLLLNGIITNGIKLMVGRPRPDFYERCFPDLKGKFDGVAPLCTGVEDVIVEGRKSFPSGHSSWSFAGMLYLSYYLAGKLQCFSSTPPKSLLSIVIALFPSLVALFIALSRYCDYWHHYQDITIGSILGAMIATLSYFYYYPSLWSVASHKAKEYELVERQEASISRCASVDRLHMVKVM